MTPPIPSETPTQRLIAAATRLRAFVRTKAPGGCKLASQGSACVCPLCDIDVLVAAGVTRTRETA